MFAIKTVGAPVTQGLGVTGMQGIGVRTPIAADVAEATDGFASEAHIPKGMMFTMGWLSMIVASGWFPVVTLLTGSTTRLLGAKPKLHCSVAPLQTCCGMSAPPMTLICPSGRPVNRILGRLTGVERMNDLSTFAALTDLSGKPLKQPPDRLHGIN